MLNRTAALLLAGAVALFGGASAEAKPSAKKRTKRTTVAMADKPKKQDTPTTIVVTDVSTTIAEEIRKADARPSTAPSPSGEKVVVVTISGTLQERGSAVSLFGEQTRSLKSYLELFRKAREDRNVKTVVIRFATADMGLATAQELQQGIEELKSRGKKTIALLESDSQSLYLAATACDEIVMPPSGDIALHGVKADMYYLKNLLDKVGVRVEVVHMGQYKSYGETFTHDQPTTPTRENMTEIVDDTYWLIVDRIASSRNLTREQVENIINRGPLCASEAVEARLVDRVAYADDVLAELKKKNRTSVVQASDYMKPDSSGSSGDLSLFSLISIMSRQQSGSRDSASSKYPQVAVVYAVGPIEMGSNDGMGFSSEEVIASEDFIETLEEVRSDKKIKAVILRVNSPGGSAFASDLIWKKIEELKKEKPVIATMGDVAASGGYYIAMGANKIIAQEGTITGSIGVVGGKPNLAGLYEKLGINKETISRGDYADIYSETSEFSSRERETVERMMKRTYDEFVGKAAEGRRMPKERLYEVAEGRIWSGSRAKNVGLVDEIGGMNKAIAEVKKALGMKQDEKVALVAYPKEMGLIDFLQKAMGTSTSARASLPVPAALAGAAGGGEAASLAALWSTLPGGLRQALSNAAAIGRMFQREQVLAVMPALPQLR